MATTYSTHRFEAAASLKFLVIENMHPHFPAHVCYGQTAGWIGIPLGAEICLVPGDIVLHGDPSPQGKGHSSPPTFRPTVLARISAGPHFTHNPFC